MKEKKCEKGKSAFYDATRTSDTDTSLELYANNKRGKCAYDRLFHHKL